MAARLLRLLSSDSCFSTQARRRRRRRLRARACVRARRVRARMTAGVHGGGISNGISNGIVCRLCGHQAMCHLFSRASARDGLLVTSLDR
jgi:hypothetical protein